MNTREPRKLTPLQKEFVRQYLIDFNATRAYQRAAVVLRKGEPSAKCAGTSGPRMLETVGIQAALTREIQKRNERVQVDQDYVLRQLITNLERALQATPVLNKSGKQTGMWQYQGSVANGALALLAKHTGGFADRMEHTGKNGGPIHIEGVLTQIAHIFVAVNRLPTPQEREKLFTARVQAILDSEGL